VRIIFLHRISVHVRCVNHAELITNNESVCPKSSGGRGARAIQTILNLPQRSSVRDLREADPRPSEERVARLSHGTIDERSVVRTRLVQLKVLELKEKRKKRNIAANVPPPLPLPRLACPVIAVTPNWIRAAIHPSPLARCCPVRCKLAFNSVALPRESAITAAGTRHYSTLTLRKLHPRPSLSRVLQIRKMIDTSERASLARSDAIVIAACSIPELAARAVL